MQYITLPGTDLRVSRVCLGTQQLSGSADDDSVGRDFTWGAVDQETATRTVGAAIEAGINFMDCAEAYNNNQAERALGVALKALGRRQDVVLASKFGKVTKPWPSAASSLIACLSGSACCARVCRCWSSNCGRVHVWINSTQHSGKRPIRPEVLPCIHLL
eukprot:COSAG02_NODE_5074_length_4664_cov_17.061117_3_plen_160_part_00